MPAAPNAATWKSEELTKSERPPLQGGSRLLCAGDLCVMPRSCRGLLLWTDGRIVLVLMSRGLCCAVRVLLWTKSCVSA